MSFEKPVAKAEVTQFNCAIACLERIHDLLVECNNVSRRCFFNESGSSSLECDSLIAWKMTLLTLFREISIKMLSAESSEIHQMVSEFDSIVILHNSGGNKGRLISVPSFNQAWEKLHNIELKLRKIADDRGMLLPNRVRDSEATEL